MAVIYVPGKYADAIRRAVALTATSEMADYEVEYIQSGRQAEVWKSDGKVASINLTADINFLKNGDLEDWIAIGDGTLDPEYWTELDGSGSITRDTGDEGSYSAKLAGDITYYQDVKVLAGKKYGMRVRLKGDAVNSARIKVYDIDSQVYLQTGGTWTTSVAVCFTRSANTWSNVAEVTFTIESPTGYGATKDLRIMMDSTAGSGVWIDDIAIYPEVDFMSCHAHNFPVGEPFFYLQRSVDNSSFVGVETVAIDNKKAFYEVFSASTYRWWRLSTTFPADRTWALGEWVLGSYETTPRDMKYNWRKTYDMPQVQAISAGTGQPYVINKSDYGKRRLSLSFDETAQADAETMLRDLHELSDFGKEPIAIVPDDTDTEVIYGRVEPSWGFNYDVNLWKHKVVITEDPFPVL